MTLHRLTSYAAAPGLPSRLALRIIEGEGGAPQLANPKGDDEGEELGEDAAERDVGVQVDI